jgi:DNA topoisomerase I
MEKAAYEISKIKRGERRRNPSPPYTTSTLQQEASRRLGYTARRTMALAQQLYEGIDIGEGGSVGLITYMRTDSTNVAESAQSRSTHSLLANGMELAFCLTEPPQYKTKSRGAQEAHEAIRPTSVLRQPESVSRNFLNRDQFRFVPTDLAAFCGLADDG